MSIKAVAILIAGILLFVGGGVAGGWIISGQASRLDVLESKLSDCQKRALQEQYNDNRLTDALSKPDVCQRADAVNEFWEELNSPQAGASQDGDSQPGATTGQGDEESGGVYPEVGAVEEVPGWGAGVGEGVSGFLWW